MAIVEELLRTWTSSTAQDGDDIAMGDAADPDAQLVQLKRCVQEFQPRIEGNTWVQSLLTSL